MSNPISIDINQDNDELIKCLPSQSGATAITDQFDQSNSSKAFSSLLFDLHNDDDEFDQLNQQMSKVLLDEPCRPSLNEAFQADMSSYLSHDKLTKNSRRMQSEYQASSPKEKEYIFHTYIKNNVIGISQDKYMHYILEKIIEVGPPSQRNFILDQIFPNINKLVKDLYACKVMQKGLEIMSQFPQDSKLQFQSYISFIHQDSSFMRDIYVDKIANQIVQKCLEVLDGAPLLKLLKILSQYILKENPVQFELSTDQYGCLIVNKIIDIFPKQYDSNIKQIANDIIVRAIDNSSCLVRRQYANYIVQQILEKGQEQHKRLLMDQYLIKDFVSMSMDKYGSNVAEKAIIYAGPSWRKRLWEEEVSISESTFRKLVDDQFANYPIQKLFEYLEMEYRNEFVMLLQKLHESNFLNHHGQIVLKFALTNFNTKKYAQKVSSADVNKTTKFQEKNKQNSNFQQKYQNIDSITQQQFQYFQQFQMQQQLMQYQQSYSPIDQQQYYMMQQMMFYQQQQQNQYMLRMPQQQQQQQQNYQQPYNLSQLQMQPPMTQEQVMMYQNLQSQQQSCSQQRYKKNGQ